jgi:hypothetical protein
MAGRSEIKLAGVSLGPARHVCAFFEDEDEAFRVVLPFVKDGLAQGDRVVFLVNPARREDTLARMRKAGIDPDAAKESGQLELVDWATPLIDRRIDWKGRLDFIERVLVDGSARKYRLTRLVADMGWVLELPLDVHELLEHETRLEELLSDRDDAVLCVYDTNQFGGRELIHMLRTHPLVIIGGVLHQNPFHLPARELLSELRSQSQ